MGEIKFRAWDKANAEMVRFEDIYIELEDGCMSVFKFVQNGFGLKDRWELDVSENNVVMMQYTGLKDKNGVEVYDGDIYRNLDSGLIGKFRILDGVGGLYVLCTEYKYGRVYNNLPFAEHDTTNFEVIGNIYENPELIGGDS